MTRVAKLLVLVAGLVSMALFGYSVLKPRSSYRPDLVQTWNSPGEELDYYLKEKADYRRQFARILAEKRIARAELIAAENPEYAAKAATVIDSVRARLTRAATAVAVDSTGR